MLMGYDIQDLVEKVTGQVLSQQGKSAPASNEVRMTLATARRVVEAVKRKAAEMGVNAVVAVADAGGNVITVDCMDDAFIASLDIAMNKAFTSVALKMPTADLARLAAPNGSLYGIQHTNNGRIVIFGGGVPLVSDGKVIGGLGVSGGTAQEDTYLGSYGGECFADMLKKGL